MPNEPTLLFLHGVGEGDPTGKWRTALNRTLGSIGYPDLDEVTVIAPRYSHALKDWDVDEHLPPVTLKRPGADAAKKNRREFERRASAIEMRLGRHDRGEGVVGGDALVEAAVALPTFAQAQNYLKSTQIRAQVLNRIISSIPKEGEIVIAGHSLGSVIAADLLVRLPAGIKVSSMITFGSPLAHGAFGVEKLREHLKDPPTNLGWWVNFWNAPDLVSAHRGVSSAFPWAVDFRLETKALFPQAHSATEYLANDAVGAAFGFALFGSLSKEVVVASQSLDIPLSQAEQVGLVALRYGHLLKARLKDDMQDRYAGALRLVQANAINDMVAVRRAAGSEVPSIVAALGFDPADSDVDAPTPSPGHFLNKDEAAVLLTVLASGNMIQPFEISIPKEILQKAMEDLTAELGLSSQFGADVFAAGKTAREALKTSTGMNWLKWSAIGAGAIAIVVATGGLALAAGAGLAGAAVITSALAAFGPGGMVGGLLTAGTLVGVGGGGIAFGLASPTTSAEALEAVVERQLTVAVLRKLQHLEHDPAIWRALVETEIEVRRQYERLDEFSDESAPTLKELKRKLAAIEGALNYLKEKDLASNPYAAAMSEG